MRCGRSIVVRLTLCVTFAAGASAQQLDMLWGVRWIPGYFKLVVGSGAEYEVTQDRQKAPLTYTSAYTVIGKERVDGAEGYWLEERLPCIGILVAGTTKRLIVIRGGKLVVKRAIWQREGGPPAEWPMTENPVDLLDRLEMYSAEGPPWIPPPPRRIGKETITVPAGSFECDHYQGKTQTGALADIWISAKVAPFGLVRMASKDTTIVLLKLLENETSQIKYEPRR